MSDTGAVCLSSLNDHILEGQYFTPFGKDFCEKCKCLAGKAVGCIFEECTQLPKCEKFKPVKGTCCDFECIKDNGLSDNTELAVLFSLGTGLVLLLVILILVLHSRRQGIKKSQEEENEMTKTAAEQSPSNMTRSSGAVPSNSESHQEECVELPPPYSEAPRSPTHSVVASGKKRQNTTPPNEPPPPYADREESAV